MQRYEPGTFSHPSEQPWFHRAHSLISEREEESFEQKKKIFNFSTNATVYFRHNSVSQEKWRLYLHSSHLVYWGKNRPCIGTDQCHWNTLPHTLLCVDCSLHKNKHKPPICNTFALYVTFRIILRTYNQFWW